MNLKKHLLLLIVSLFLTNTSMASFYVSAFGGTSKLAADNSALKDKFKGSTLGFNLGYKLLFIAPEIGMRKSSVDGTVTHRSFISTASATDTVTVDIESFMTTIGARVFLIFSVLDIHGGYAFHKLDTTVLLNNTDVTTNAEFDSIKGDDSGAYFGIGVQAPLPFIDIFANMDFFKLTSTGFIETVIGIRFFF